MPACRQPLSRWTNSLSEGAFWFVLFYCSPSVTACAVPAPPQAVEPFGLCNSAQKPALKGEVAMSDSELTEGLHRGCSFFPSTPQSPCGDSSPSGEPFSTVQAHCTVPYPSRSDRFNGVTGGAGGPKGRNRNLPRPPLQKSITSSLLFPVPSASLQGRSQRGCRGCRGRSLRPRRWRAPVRRPPECRRPRI